MAKKPKVTVKKLADSDIRMDQDNINKGTERGSHLINQSIKELGAGRSVLTDKDGNLIAGNKTTEEASAAGIEEIIEVETDGSQLVVVKRTDIDLYDPTDKRGRKLAIVDNRTQELSYEVDPANLQKALNEGVDLSLFYTDEEVKEIMGEGQASHPPDPGDQVTWKSVVVKFHTLEALADFAGRVGQNIDGSTVSIWHPEE